MNRDRFGERPGKILQIIPAPHWYVQYRADNGGLHEWRVSFWALMKEDEEGENTVRGIDMSEGYADVCSEASNFLRYIPEEFLGHDPDTQEE